MLFILLLFSTLLHCVYSQFDPGVDPVLYKAIQKAVVKDESNLLTLQDVFYSLDNSNKQIQFRIPECSFMVAVKNNTHPGWSNCSHCDSDLPSGYYCYNQDVYIGNYSDIKSKELFSYVEVTTEHLGFIVEFSSVRLFDFLTNQNLASASSSVITSTLSIHIDDELDSLPDSGSFEIEDTLLTVLLWAKYYARTQGSSTEPILDTDKLFYSASTYSDDKSFIPLCLYYIVTVLTLILVSYGLSKTLQWIKTNCRELPYIKSFYWATVIVCGTINISCAVISFVYSIDSFLFSATPLFFIVEVIAVWIIVKDFKTSNSKCGTYVLRAVYTLATCHILWFIHRVTLNLIVAMYFIAVAPVQTLAAITLVYSVIFCTIVYVAYNLHCFKLIQSNCCTKRGCKMSCKLFVIFLVYCGTVGILICFTLIFNEMVHKGLTSSGLGSVLLSLVAPTIVFIITLSLKGHVKKWFKAAKLSHNDIENPPEVVEDLPEVAENGNGVEYTEATPLLINREV